MHTNDSIKNFLIEDINKMLSTFSEPERSLFEKCIWPGKTLETETPERLKDLHGLCLRTMEKK